MLHGPLHVEADSWDLIGFYYLQRGVGESLLDTVDGLDALRVNETFLFIQRVT